MYSLFWHCNEDHTSSSVVVFNAQYSTLQYSIVQYSAARPVIEPHALDTMDFVFLTSFSRSFPSRRAADRSEKIQRPGVKSATWTTL